MQDTCRIHQDTYCIGRPPNLQLAICIGNPPYANPRGPMYFHGHVPRYSRRGVVASDRTSRPASPVESAKLNRESYCAQQTVDSPLAPEPFLTHNTSQPNLHLDAVNTRTRSFTFRNACGSHAPGRACSVRGMININPLTSIRPRTWDRVWPGRTG
jgi:hypothetical protein